MVGTTVRDGAMEHRRIVKQAAILGGQIPLYRVRRYKRVERNGRREAVVNMAAK